MVPVTAAPGEAGAQWFSRRKDPAHRTASSGMSTEPTDNFLKMEQALGPFPEFGARMSSETIL